MVIALLRTLRWPFVQVFIPRLCFIGFTIAQPFLLLRTVEAVSNGHVDRITSNSLIGASVIIYFGLAVSSSSDVRDRSLVQPPNLGHCQITRTLFEHWEYRVVTFVRGILVVSIYEKLLRLSAEDLENSGAVTLMSTDVEGTGEIIALVYESTSCLIQVAFGIWILFSFIGPACFLILVPTFGE